MLKTEGTSEKRPSVEVEEPLETSNEVTQDTDRINKKKNKQSTECPHGKHNFAYIRAYILVSEGGAPQYQAFPERTKSRGGY